MQPTAPPTDHRCPASTADRYAAPMHGAVAKRAEPRRLRAAWWLLGAFALVVIAFAAGAVALAGMSPSWYTQPAPRADDPARAEALERRVLSTLSDAHPFGTTWTITISDQDAALWINHRLPAWLANQPANARAPRGWSPDGPGASVSFKPRFVRIGLRARVAGSDAVAWARVPMPLTPALTPNVSTRAGTDRWSFGIGRLALPRPLLGALASDTQRLIEDALASAASNPSRSEALAELTLDDGRRVLLTRVEANEGTLTVFCRTEARKR